MLHDLLLHAPSSPLPALILGGLLLCMGRKLFWLFVAVAGCAAGWSLALGLSHGRPSGGQLLLALAGAVLGVLLAVFVQKAAVALAGFVVGTATAASLMGLDPGHLHLHSGQQGVLLIALVAGVVAAVAALWLFDAALVILSSLAGATLILDGLHLAHANRLLPLLLIATLGVVIQAGTFWHARSHPAWAGPRRAPGPR
ncbi:MAG: hypothetical protein M3O15_04445 [Acidobacteriota bacterium]|nr:hypothetical protein [Acidobacteriota bacterium]